MLQVHWEKEDGTPYPKDTCTWQDEVKDGEHSEMIKYDEEEIGNVRTHTQAYASTHASLSLS